jgi:recombination protein RecT
MTQTKPQAANSQLATQIAAKNPATAPMSIKHQLHDWKEKNLETLQSFLGGHKEDAERLYLAFAHTVSRSTDLLECTKESLVTSLLQCAQLGLYPGPFQEAAIVSYRNKDKGIKEAQFIPQYQGLVKLGKQSKHLIDIHANVVYAADEFDFEEGSKKYLRHKKSLLEARGERVAVYACATLSDGGHEFIVLAPHEVEHIKKRSKSAKSDFSPWTTDTDQMWKKTAIKQLCKLIPKQGDAGKKLAEAIEVDNEIERPDLRKTPIMDLVVIEEETPVNETDQNVSDTGAPAARG